LTFEKKPKMSTLRLNLIVLRALDIDKTRIFYEALGFAFNEEKHGKGPLHYSCTVNEMVLEIYPIKPEKLEEYRGIGPLMFGFNCEAIDKVLGNLKKVGITILARPRETTFGKQIVIQDPDGRNIELTEK